MSEIVMQGRRLAMAVRTAYLTMHREADSVLKPFGITTNQFVVLLTLSGEAMNQNALAERIASDRNTIRPILLSLQKQKFIKRSPDANDRRALIVELTKSGRKKFDEVQAADLEFLTKLISPFSKRELEQIIAQLGRLEDVIGEGNQSELADSASDKLG